jgi:hypothetical protein
MRKNSTFSKLLDEVRKPAAQIKELSQWEVWSKNGPLIWNAERFKNTSSFYPLYRYKNLYSYSLFGLILKKGNLVLNKRIAKKVALRKCPYLPDNDTIDCEIKREGGALKPSFQIRSPKIYARDTAQAMCQDIANIEAFNKNHTNIILCGGRDSLNLLLLPWKNPVIVASAPPNYALVKTFIEDNDLDYEVIALDDENNSLLNMEILVNCCRNDL